MEPLAAVQTLCEAAGPRGGGGAGSWSPRCAEALAAVICGHADIRASETLRSAAQDACVAIACGHRGGVRWGSLRALAALGTCSVPHIVRLAEAVIRNEEPVDVQALRALAAVVPAQGAAEQAVVDRCAHASKAHLIAAVHELLRARTQNQAQGADLAARLFKSGFLDLLSEDTLQPGAPQPSEASVSSAQSVAMILDALGLSWSDSSYEPLSPRELPASFALDHLLDEVLALPMSTPAAAVCFGALALHVDSLTDGTEHGALARVLDRLRKVSIAGGQSSDTVERWLWPLLCLLRVLAAEDAPAATAIAADLPASARLPLHAQHWNCAARTLALRSHTEIQAWALKLYRGEVWFNGSQREAAVLTGSALSAGRHCVVTALELAFPHVVLVPETWRAAFARRTQDPAYTETSVELLGLLTVLVFKGSLREVVDFAVPVLSNESPWQLRAAHLNLAAALGARAQLDNWDAVFRILLHSQHIEEREAACACALLCRPEDEALRYGILSNLTSRWAARICMTNPHYGWAQFATRILGPTLTHSASQLASMALPDLVVVSGRVPDSHELLVRWSLQS